VDRATLTRIALAMLGMTAITFGLGAIDFASDLGTDYGGYFSDGWFMTRGLVPYRDFWMHKTPFLAVVLAGWIRTFGAGFYAAAAFPLAVTAVAATIVYWFASTLRFPRVVAALSSGLFAFFAAYHGLDATRNGVIVIAAASSEMLALIAALAASGTRRRWLFAVSGLFLSLAIATRQPTLVTAIPIALIVATARATVRNKAVDAAIWCAGIASGVVMFAAFFAAHQVRLGTLIDDLYRFNIVLAEGHRLKMTWWLSGWARLAWIDGLGIVVAGVVCFAWLRIIAPGGDAVVKRQTMVLGLMIAVHAVAIYLAQKVHPIYTYQLLPEACVMTAAAAREITRLTSAWNARQRAALAMGAFVAFAAWPLAIEVSHWHRAVQNARDGGYLLHPENLPSQVLARRVRELAPRETDRIWTFSASADAVYPFANRLPALRLTNTAPLVYEMTGDDFGLWRREFDAGRPAVVVSVYGDAFAARYARQPDDENGQTTATILRIREYLLTHMRRVGSEGSDPELYVPDTSASS
jgi:hypothetical protein